MSLKAFHLIFIIASIVLAFGFGVWLVAQYFSAGGVLNLIFAVLSFAAGVGLIAEQGLGFQSAGGCDVTGCFPQEKIDFRTATPQRQN